MSTQHLSDEAVAAFADGVLGGRARDRATRHVNSCPECHQAVRAQREAAYALRAAAPPALPGPLADRLRSLPMTTPITTLPTVVAPDGSTMLSTFAPAAALVPAHPPAGPGGGRVGSASKPLLLSVAAAVLVGGGVAAAAVGTAGPGSGGAGHPSSRRPGTEQVDLVLPAQVFRDVTP